MATKIQPRAGVDYDRDAPMDGDDYEWFTSTGEYEGDGWAEFMERHACPRCRSLNHVPCYGLDITARECCDCGEEYSAEE